MEIKINSESKEKQIEIKTMIIKEIIDNLNVSVNTKNKIIEVLIEKIRDIKKGEHQQP